MLRLDLEVEQRHTIQFKIPVLSTTSVRAKVVRERTEYTNGSVAENGNVTLAVAALLSPELG